jgi:single-strand DNA-binding protein
MASANHVMLLGNITRDPELRYTPSGSAVCTLGLAINEKRTNKNGDMTEETTFVDVDVWAKTAENCAEYLKKGSPVLVSGKLAFRTWEDKDGGRRSKLSVTAFNVQFLDFNKPKDDAAKEKKVAYEGTQPYLGDDDDVPF